MERISQRKVLRGLVLAFVIAVSGFALAACGSEHHEKTGIVEGEPVELGPLQYNVLFTRPLNIHDIEDSEYLVGKKPPGPNQMYIGVFVRVHNLDEDEAHAIPDSFVIRTTTGREYENIPVDSPYALEPGAVIEPEGNLPKINSTPEVGPIQASMLLFRMDDASTENRPVRLIIEGEEGPAEVDLDL